jgi:hypothetical protein
MTVGPLRLEIVEPFRRLRIVVEPNDTGITADLQWRSRVGALMEDHTVMTDGPHVIVDMARFVQFGTWEGEVVVDGLRTELRHDEVIGVRDRSWGIRPVGAQPAGRPSASVPKAWLWTPTHFDHECLTAGWFQRPGGAFDRPDGHRVAVTAPVAETVELDGTTVRRVDPVGQRLSFAPGTRWITAASVDLVDHTGAALQLDLTPRNRFDMRALGYMNPEWGHGLWHGELELGREDWTLADVSAQDPTHQHVHHLVEARLTDTDGTVHEGVGMLEQIIFGPHTQFGFHEILDGASA